MAGAFVRMQLVTSGVILDRVTSQGGLSLYADHDTSVPIGRVTRAYTEGDALFVEGELATTARSAPLIEELDNSLRSGASPGFLIWASELVEDDDEYILRITKWEPYEASTTGIGRNPHAGLTHLDPPESRRASMSPGPTSRPAPQVDVRQAVHRAKASAQAELEKAREDLQAAQAEGLRMKHKNNTKPAPEFVPPREGGAGTSLSASPRRYPDPARVVAALTGDKQALKAVENTVEIAGQPGASAHVKFDWPLMQEAAISADPSSGVSDEGLRPDFNFRNEGGILRLFDAVEVTGDQTAPLMDSDPVTRMRAEHAAPATVTDVAFVDPAPTLEPHIAEGVVRITDQMAFQAPGAVSALLMSLDRALVNKVVQQVLNGSGQGDEVLGALSTVGINSHPVQAGDLGKLSSFHEAEDTLAVSVPRLRRAWVLDEQLWRTARQTFIVPGASPRVLQRGLIGDDSRGVLYQRRTESRAWRLRGVEHRESGALVYCRSCL